MKSKTFFIETHGCQMNMYDSQVVSDILSSLGYERADSPIGADLVLVNTCSVRDRAERKALSRIAELRATRGRKPNMLIGVMGCMAQRLGKLLVARYGVDLVVGPDSYKAIPQLLEQIGRSSEPVVDVIQDSTCLYTLSPRTCGSISAFATIMRGCDNYCSYCIVPYVRGRERSKPLPAVVREVTHLVDLGIKEITLLGQNVNSYRHGSAGFAEVLEAVHEVEGLQRIRFTTSHPKDLTQGILEKMRDLPKVCESLHLPVQSGSDRVLALMNRDYTCDHYRHLVDRARTVMPDLAITTDIMVGFPTERRPDHGATLKAMRDIRFDSAFMFRYSPRPGTKAAGYPDDVEEEEKIRRLQEVIALQNAMVDDKKRLLVGTEIEILVENSSKREPGWLVGRTRKNWLAKLPQKGVSKGETVVAKVTDVTRWMIVCEGSVRKVGGNT
jgi:tRNA-2-methylthio-N6-dimethylallyladenosine synthase